MCSHLSEMFESQGFSSYLYAASICVQEYGLVDGGTFSPLLFKMLHTISASFFSKARSLAEFEKCPDVVEEYFYMVARSMQCCPAQLVAFNGMRTIVLACLTALEVPHRGVQKGSLTFLHKFSSIAAFSKFDSVTSKHVKDIVKESLLSICLSFLLNVSGRIPPFALLHDDIADVLFTMKTIENLGVSFEEGFESAVQSLPNQASREVVLKVLSEKRHILQMGARQRDLSEFLTEITMNCTNY